MKQYPLAVLAAVERYEAAAVEHAQIVMGVVDRNEHRSRTRLDEAADELLQSVRAWRMNQNTAQPSNG